MGNDVFGTMRYACQTAGCGCKEYLCVIDAMTDEERAMTVVHHPRNDPGYVTCTCEHAVHAHATDKREAAAVGPLGSLEQLLVELGAFHLAQFLRACTLAGLADEAEAAGRTAFLAVLKERGVAKLPERQALANAISKADRAGRIIGSAQHSTASQNA